MPEPSDEVEPVIVVQQDFSGIDAEQAQSEEFQDAIEGLMKYEIPILPLPEHLIISNELIDDEKPKAPVKYIEVKK